MTPAVHAKMTPADGVPQDLLLSPANCAGVRARMVMSERASFPLAMRLRGEEGAPIGEVFSFLSGLYFRGKVTYARAFAAPPDPESPISGAGVFVITPTAGLRSADTLVTLDALRTFATVDVDAGNPEYRRPTRTIPRRSDYRHQGHSGPYLLPGRSHLLWRVLASRLPGQRFSRLRSWPALERYTGSNNGRLFCIVEYTNPPY